MKLCDQGRDQSPDTSRALCSACLDYHKINCFFSRTLQEDPRWRVCKKDASLRLCPCLCVDLDTIANLENPQRFRTGHTPIDVEHSCGLIDRSPDTKAVSIAAISGYWDLKSALTVNYERNVFNGVDADISVGNFMVGGRFRSSFLSCESSEDPYHYPQQSTLPSRGGQ